MRKSGQLACLASSFVIHVILKLDIVKEKDFVCLAYNRSKIVKKFNLKLFLDLPRILNILERDILKVKFKLYNKRLMGLFIIDYKSRFK